MADEVLADELHKLKKYQLIALLATKKVPEGVVLNDLLKDFFGSLWKTKENQSSDSERRDNLTNNDNTAFLKREVSFLKQQLRTQEVLSDQLLKRTADQEYIINTLQKENQNINGTGLVPHHRQPNTPLSIDTGSDRNKQTYNQVAQRNKETTQDKRTEDRKLDAQVTRKKTAILGTSTNNSAATFKAAERRGWLYIGRADEKTTTNDIKTFLEREHKGKSFTVEEITKHETNKSKNKSFKVGVDYEMLELLRKPENWPRGIVVQRYQFFRRSQAGEGHPAKKAFINNTEPQRSVDNK